MYQRNEGGDQGSMVARRPMFKAILVLAVAAMLALGTSSSAWAQSIEQNAAAGNGSNISQQASQNVTGDVNSSGGSSVSVFQGSFPFDDDANGFDDDDNGFDDDANGLDDDDNGFDDDDNGFDDDDDFDD